MRKYINLFFQSRYGIPTSYIACSNDLVASLYRLKRDCEDTIAWLDNRTGDISKDYDLREKINRSIAFILTKKESEHYKEILEKINSDIKVIHDMIKWDEDVTEFIYKELKL